MRNRKARGRILPSIGDQDEVLFAVPKISGFCIEWFGVLSPFEKQSTHSWHRRKGSTPLTKETNNQFLAPCSPRKQQESWFGLAKSRGLEPQGCGVQIRCLLPWRGARLGWRGHKPFQPCGFEQAAWWSLSSTRRKGRGTISQFRGSFTVSDKELTWQHTIITNNLQFGATCAAPATKPAPFSGEPS